MVSRTFSFLDYVEAVPAGAETPVLMLDLAVLREDLAQFGSGFPGARRLYAVKANPHPDVLSTVAAMGGDFEISSVGELRLLQELGIPGSRIISSNPVKTPAFLVEARRAGMAHFAFDSTDEADKLAELAPEAELSIRLTVPNTGSDWPLDKKFGVDGDQALALMTYARQRGLRPSGITFHVGSQCRDVESWRYAMGQAKELWDRCLDRDMQLRVLNVGGGMPIDYTGEEVPSIGAVGRTVLEAFEGIFPSDTELWIEPGRAVVGRAGVMVCSVIGAASRDGTRWVYLDAGVFHGLAEAAGGIRYRYVTRAEGSLEPCTVAGPSCDSVDVISEEVMLPPVRTGDIVAIPACGAYTTAYASNFNGFPGPRTIIINDA